MQADSAFGRPGSVSRNQFVTFSPPVLCPVTASLRPGVIALEQDALKAFLLNPRPVSARRALEWGVVAEVVKHGETLGRAREIAAQYLKFPEVTRRNTRVHFIQPLKERIVREVGYGLSLRGRICGRPRQIDAESRLSAKRRRQRVGRC